MEGAAEGTPSSQPTPLEKRPNPRARRKPGVGGRVRSELLEGTDLRLLLPESVRGDTVTAFGKAEVGGPA